VAAAEKTWLEPMSGGSMGIRSALRGHLWLLYAAEISRLARPDEEPRSSP
jgi:hypothetical protein